jgi:carbon storage regulator
MLVVSRKVGETILIGEQIAVSIVRIGPGAVRIGVQAPPDIAVVRGELIGVHSDVGRESPEQPA